MQSFLVAVAPACAVDTATPSGASDEAVETAVTGDRPDSPSDNVTHITRAAALSPGHESVILPDLDNQAMPSPAALLEHTPSPVASISNRNQVIGSQACAPCTGGGVQGCTVISSSRFVGCAKSGSFLLTCLWSDTGVTEDFVIAPNRTIWHSWNSSGGWVEMPNNGRADDTGICFLDSRRHAVDVFVASASAFWESFIDPVANAWVPWFREN
jgi:hypothetical protein